MKRSVITTLRLNLGSCSCFGDLLIHALNEGIWRTHWVTQPYYAYNCRSLKSSHQNGLLNPTQFFALEAFLLSIFKPAVLSPRT